MATCVSIDVKKLDGAVISKVYAKEVVDDIAGENDDLDLNSVSVGRFVNLLSMSVSHPTVAQEIREQLQNAASFIIREIR